MSHTHTETETEMRGQMTDPTTIRNYVYAGDATLTLLNTNTGVRYTFSVAAPYVEGGRERDTKRDLYFVKLLNGPDNGGNYVYMGMIHPSKVTPAGPALISTKKSKVTVDAPSWKAADWMLRLLASGKDLPAGLEVWHEGNCGRCGRRLTVPESIERGLGPVCAGKMDS